MSKIVKSRLKNLSLLQLTIFILILLLFTPAFALALNEFIDGNLYENILFSIEFTFYGLPPFFALLLCLIQFPESMERIRLTKKLEFKVNLCCIASAAFISAFIPIFALVILAIYHQTTQIFSLGMMIEVYIRYLLMFVTIGLIQYLGALWLKNKWYMTGFLMISFSCLAFLYYIKTDFGNLFKIAFFYLTPPVAESGHSLVAIIPVFVGSSGLLSGLCYFRLVTQEHLS